MPGRRLVAGPADPMAVARQYVAERHMQDDLLALRAWRGAFHGWDGRCWPEVEMAALEADLYAYLEHAVYEVETRAGRKERPWQPTRTKIANVVHALRAITHLPETVQPPAWLDGDDRHEFAPRDLIVTANGILHVPTRSLLPHEPQLFVGHALPFGYDATAAQPDRWEALLTELWPQDAESVACLQELFGYIVSGDTSLQKIGLLVGPTRAGKGVIANVASHLIGLHNATAPTLAAMTQNFGLQDLIGKLLAVVSDARLGRNANVAALAERLLSISGEDRLTIDRKYREPWTGRLDVRFLLLSNELPSLTDASGALAKRFIVLVLTQSFYDREDPSLLSKLLPELPGILLWSLDGLDRLRLQGHFTVPASARDAMRELEDLASPVTAFLRERCQVGRDQHVRVDDLWTVWKGWCEDQSHAHGTKQTFGKDLRAAVPGLRRRQLGSDQVPTYFGVGLRDDRDSDPRVSRVSDFDGKAAHAPSREGNDVLEVEGRPELRLSMDWDIVERALHGSAGPPACTSCGTPLVAAHCVDHPFVCTNPGHPSRSTPRAEA